MTADNAWAATAPSARVAGYQRSRVTSRTAMTDRPILRCSTATKTSPAVVERRQASHANSYHYGRYPPLFTRAVAVGDIERNDGEPPALDNPGTRTQLAVNTRPTTREGSTC